MVNFFCAETGGSSARAINAALRPTQVRCLVNILIPPFGRCLLSENGLGKRVWKLNSGISSQRAQCVGTNFWAGTVLVEYGERERPAPRTRDLILAPQVAHAPRTLPMLVNAVLCAEEPHEILGGRL